MAVLLPELLYRDDAFHGGLAVECDEHTGRIARIASAAELQSPAPVALPGIALMPGFVNAHSHAFQRLIRGATQWRPADTSLSNFWSWRESMYRAALSLSPDDIYHVSRFCFLEMLRAGITTVGEFHYLHNAVNGRPYDDRAELARRVIDAARSVGIRIRLLNACYVTGAVGRPLQREQLRFATPDLDAYLAATERITAASDGDLAVTVGVAPHSVRAVPRDWLAPLHDWAAARDLPVHMHVSEQPAEVDDCVAAYGLRPVELLAEEGVLDGRLTAVHATHITDAEVARLATSSATVCACPSTERDLGDGLLRGADLLRAGGRIALGSDSQTLLDMLEEARLVEYIERLRRLERVVITRATNDALEAAPILLRMATSAGAHSLRLPAGTLEEGALADFVGLDLAHPALAGWTTHTLAAMLVFSAPPGVVRDVWVGGRRVVADRVHDQEEEAIRAFNVVARR
ncbi:MAG TPA: formimidoylglutamate deiminase [Longimicrobiales bacterium]